MTAVTSTFGNTGVSYQIREGEEQMNAGRYRVTDPCYFLGHDDEFWAELIDFMFPNGSGRGCDTYTIEIAGYKVLMWGTAYGDGEYPTLFDGSVVGRSGVDAGLLSLIPEELYILLKSHLGENDDETAPFIELKGKFSPHVEGGDCEFGKYKILTGDTAYPCDRCGDYCDTNWNNLCDSCQYEADEEEEEREREEEERRQEEEED
jgi:hypothetical protein